MEDKVEVHWASDAQLMGYGESDSSGAWIKLQVEADDLEHFRGMKGTVFQVVLVALQDDGTLLPTHTEKVRKTGSHMAEWLGARAHEKQFAVFLHKAYGVGTEELFDVAAATRKVLGVKSRAEVDTDPAAGERCKGMISRYSMWVKNG